MIDCLFGTAETKDDLEAGWDGRTPRISYAKYPSLPGVLLLLLQSGIDAAEVESQQKAAESVFPALDVIRRAGPPDALRGELFRCVAHHLGSHLWHVREMAARTACSFLIRGDWGQALSKLLEDAGHSQNKLHGALMAARFTLTRARELGDSSYDCECCAPRWAILLTISQPTYSSYSQFWMSSPRGDSSVPAA